jgi:hypothetical protein
MQAVGQTGECVLYIYMYIVTLQPGCEKAWGMMWAGLAQEEPWLRCEKDAYETKWQWGGG